MLGTHPAGCRSALLVPVVCFRNEYPRFDTILDEWGSSIRAKV